MATIQNRSRYFVSVIKRPDLTKEFPFNQQEKAVQYRRELLAQDFKPKIGQYEDQFEVRIRQKGYPNQQFTAGSLEEAENFVKKVEEERSRGLFIDYTKSHKISFAELLPRYLRKESCQRKSAALEAYKIEGWLEDSGPVGQALLQAHRNLLRTEGKPVRKSTLKMRETANSIQWIHKKLTEITTNDVEEFVRDRLQDVAPATVDREIDIIKSVFKVATVVWGYDLARNPMDALRRPTYFNERDRRLIGDEEERLMAALFEVDRARGIEIRLKELAGGMLENMTFSGPSARKKVLLQIRKELLAEAEQTYTHVPWMQAFFQFQLMTAARRGETMQLTWERIDFAEKTAFLPETKNGRARKLALRDDLLNLLATLPRNGKYVFPFSLDVLRDDWAAARSQAKTDNLHIHDLRHEAISRVAETGKFTLMDLQTFSGHRDTRMLLRYTHLCASRLASKLDEAFADNKSIRVHRGRLNLSKNAKVKIGELRDVSIEQVLDSNDKNATSPVGGKETKCDVLAPLPANVVRFPQRRTA